MPGEVKVVATLDTSDVDNGVVRISEAARRINRVINDSIQADSSKAEEAGEDLGDLLSKGFIKRLVIRDAIYTVIRGLGTAIEEAKKDLEGLAGVQPINLSLWKVFGDQIADMALHLSGIQNSIKGHGESSLREINADEEDRKALVRFKRDPNLLKLSGEDLDTRLENQIEQQAENHRNNARQHIFAAASQDVNATSGTFMGGANILDNQLAGLDRRSEKDQAYTRELIAIAKQRDREGEAKGRRDEKAAFHSIKSVEEAGIFMAGEERKDEAKSEKAAEAKAKRDAAHQRKVEEHQDSEKIAADELNRHGATKDLDFTRRQLEHQHATSAVSINGSLFGRNDSAAALVQHASQQVSLLRSIDSEIKMLRKEKSDLTLQ